MVQQVQTPDMATDYPLTPDVIGAFRRDGHIFLPTVASREEVAIFRPAIVETAQRYKRETRKLEERDTYGKAFLQIENLWTKDETVAKFSLARRFAKVAAGLMEVDAVSIYQDQALFKEGGGGYTPMHQDQYYWPLDTDNTITMWMPLVDLPADVGGMRFASGSQMAGYLGNFPITDEAEKVLQQVIKERGLNLHETGAISAGDATFHAGWTLHGAPPNPTKMMREVMTIIYFADGAHLVEPETDVRRRELEILFPGLKPGDFASGSLHPIVYRREIEGAR